MNWKRLFIIGIALGLFLTTGCGEEPQGTPTSAIDPTQESQVKEWGWPELAPIDPTDHDAYLAGVAAVLGTPDPDYWIPLPFTVDPNELVQEQKIIGSNWDNDSWVRVVIRPYPGFYLMKQPAYTICAPIYPRNFGEASIFKFDGLPECCRVIITVSSDLLEIPGSGDNDTLTSYIVTEDLGTGDISASYWQTVIEPEITELKLIIEDYVKPDENSRQGVGYDPSNPPDGVVD